MNRMLVTMLAFVLAVLLVGVASAVSGPPQYAPPAMQRATPTPSPTEALRLPVTIAVLPLPVAIEITGTHVLTPTPPLTVTGMLTLTPAITSTASLTTMPAITRTQTVTATTRSTPASTPTPVRRSTPTPAASSADVGGTAVPSAASGIVDFSATTSRLRGQIQLSWRYIGAAFSGNFIVERSANGGAWRYAPDCALAYDPVQELYRCRDTGLPSGSTFVYRICIADRSTSCSGADIVEAPAVKAP